MADKFWENAPIVTDDESSQLPGSVFIPNRAGQRAEARDNVRTDLAVEGGQRDAARFGSDVDNRRIDNSISLSEKFNKDADVAGYRESLTNFASGLRTAPNPQGDNALITAYVKVFDPGSVVNEGEREGVASSQGAIANQIEAAKKNFGMDGAGLFTPEARARIRREMSSIMGNRNRLYNERRSFFRKQAENFNLDPNIIIGEHAGARFRDEFTAYDEANGQQKPSDGGSLPGATPDNIAFDMDTGRGAFGSRIEALRLTPPQQSALDAFLRANSGNPNFGPGQLSAFYQSMGIQGGAMPGDDAFFEAVRKGEGFGTTPNYEQADAERRRAAMEASYQEVPKGEDVGGYGFDKGLLLNMTDEVRGGIGGIKSMISGDGFGAGYERERDIERALQERSRAEEGLAPEIIGGIMTPVGLVSKGNMVRDGIAMGAVAGFGEGEGAADSLSKAATGAAIGGLAGKGVEKAAPIVAQSGLGQRVSQALAPRVPNAERAAFADAAERQGLDYLPADIPGATKTQLATSVARSTLGAIPLKNAATKIVEKARAARDRIAGNVGEVTDDAGAGQAVQRGMEAWERRTSGRGGQLYDAIPIRPDTTVDLSTTRAKLADLNGSISSNDDLAALVRDPRMAAYQRALDSGDLSWADIKKFRSYIGEKAGRPTLQQDTSKDSLDALYGALSKDIERAAASHSPEAAKAFSRANTYWRGRQARVSDVMSKLVGKDGNATPEATFNQIERWARAKGGDHASLMRTMRSLPEDEASTVRATIIDRLGDANPGAQNVEGTGFSPNVFLTQWSKMSPRAKAVLFQGDHRQALDDLAKVMEGTKFSRSFDNNSGTGLAASSIATVGAGATIDATTGLGLAAAQLAGGALLASPRVAKWIAAAARKPNPAAQLAHIDRLTAIARSEPVIANDIFTLQERLADAYAAPLTRRSAAEERDDLGKEKPAEGKRDGAQ